MKYHVIADYIREQISVGNISPGEKMPSVRDLCDRFSCTKATAVRAYYELKEQGIVYAVPGSGYYLINNFTEHNHADDIVDFSGTSLDIRSLPYDEFQPCIGQAINKYKENLFSYTDPQGLESLIETLRRHLENHQVFASNERIYVTTGSQQALNILTRMPFPNGKNHVVIEQPTYKGMIQSLKLNEVTAVGVSRGFQGLDFDHLEKIFRNDHVKFFYTIPRFSNPLGVSYTNDEKKKILALAEKYNVYIVEDDYLGDLESDAKSTPIFSFDKSDRVIYVKTFSKVLLPGLRIAVVVLPKILTNIFREYKYWSDLNTPLLSQGALEIYLTSGLFNKHMNKVRDLYINRMAHLKQLAEKRSSPSIRWHVPANGGFYAGIEIMNRNKGKTVREGLFKRNIMLSDTEQYFLKEFYNDKILRISIANTQSEAMEAGIEAIIDEIEHGSQKASRSIDL